jgi:hypothetical protein
MHVIHQAYWASQFSSTVHYRVLDISPCDRMADQAAAHSQSLKKVSYHISLAQENILILNLKYGLCWMYLTFAPS